MMNSILQYLSSNTRSDNQSSAEDLFINLMQKPYLYPLTDSSFIFGPLRWIMTCVMSEGNNKPIGHINSLLTINPIRL